jgi:pimeloyl-ACP methyl ester carboxylesterase
MNVSRNEDRLFAAQSPVVGLVLLHGIGGAARIWTPQMESFAKAGFKPLALDLPGYGGRPAVEALDFEMLAQDVEDAIARAALDRPVILGHSMGGMIAQTMLRQRPQAYRAAILSGTSAAFGDPSGDFQKKFLADRLAPLDRGKSMAELAAEIVDGLVGPSPDSSGRLLAIECMGGVPISTYRACVHALVGFDERANLAHIKVPVLCLAAEHDRNAPAAMMARLAARIPGARYACLPGVGHLPNLEAPQLFNTAVLDFLRAALPDAGAASDRHHA